ncbi:MAG: M24 family metallopeptidase, partial [Alphaproteobacteria bacterium]
RDARLDTHPDEIAPMRAAAAIADHAHARYAEEIRPGRLLQELDHAMAAVACIEAARAVPGEDFQILKFMTLSGPAAASPHGDGGQAGARVLDDAVAVTICNVRLNGLSIEDQRTFLCGEPGAALRRVVDTARRATAAGVEASVSGAPLAGVDAATQAVIEGAGYGDCLLHRTGHGIGVATHEYPEDMAFDPRPLLAGEVIVVEPGIYLPGAGAARFVDVVAVGAPSEVLTRAPRDAALAPFSARAA